MDNIETILDKIQALHREFDEELKHLSFEIGKSAPAPAPDPPYEMLGEVSIKGDIDCWRDLTKSDPPLLIDGSVGFIGRVSQYATEDMGRLLHEHSCGREALGILKQYCDYHKDRAERVEQPLWGNATKCLARLNAGPEKGV